MSNAFYNWVYNAVLVAFLVYACYVVYEKYSLTTQPCQRPLGYTVGEVDPRFGLERAELLRAILAAEEIWEKNDNGEDMNIFTYDQSALLQIHFRYDERQQQTIEADERQSDLIEKRQQYEQLEGSITQKNAVYEEQLVNYERDLESYTQEINAHNLEIQRINQSGPADEKKIAQLEARQDNLESTRQTLESDRLSLNAAARDLQIDVDRINEFGGKINVEAQDFNAKFAIQRQFDQGEFTGEDIVIYQYKQFEDLALVIAHELGHARGLGHVDDDAAVMNAVYHDQQLKTLQLTAADRAELARACNPL